MQFKCRSCGFRVHSNYFRDKPRFDPQVCPNDGGIVEIVADYTNNVIANARVVNVPGPGDPPRGTIVLD